MGLKLTVDPMSPLIGDNKKLFPNNIDGFFKSLSLTYQKLCS